MTVNFKCVVKKQKKKSQITLNTLLCLVISTPENFFKKSYFNFTIQITPFLRNISVRLTIFYILHTMLFYNIFKKNCINLSKKVICH